MAIEYYDMLPSDLCDLGTRYGILIFNGEDRIMPRDLREVTRKRSIYDALREVEATRVKVELPEPLADRKYMRCFMSLEPLPGLDGFHDTFYWCYPFRYAKSAPQYKPDVDYPWIAGQYPARLVPDTFPKKHSGGTGFAYDGKDHCADDIDLPAFSTLGGNAHKFAEQRYGGPNRPRAWFDRWVRRTTGIDNRYCVTMDSLVYWDHTHGDGNAVITQPYHENPWPNYGLAKYLGCEFITNLITPHNPGACMRFEYRPKGHENKNYRWEWTRERAHLCAMLNEARGLWGRSDDEKASKIELMELYGRGEL